MAEYDRMSRTENPNWKPADYVAPTQTVEEEGGGGGGGGKAEWRPTTAGPWGMTNGIAYQPNAAWKPDNSWGARGKAGARFSSDTPIPNYSNQPPSMPSMSSTPMPYSPSLKSTPTPPGYTEPKPVPQPVQTPSADYMYRTINPNSWANSSGGFQYEVPTPQIMSVADTLQPENPGTTTPLIYTTPPNAGDTGGDTPTPTPAPVPTPTIDPNKDTWSINPGAGTGFGVTDIWSFLGKLFSNNANTYGGFQYMPPNDYRAQGNQEALMKQQEVLGNIAGIQGYNQNQAPQLPSFQSISAPSSPAVANGFPDRARDIPGDTGANSFTSGEKVNMTDTTKKPSSNRYLKDENWWRLVGDAFTGVPDKKIVNSGGAPKKTWYGYGGGGGGGGGYSGARWQDFLGGMNWKI